MFINTFKHAFGIDFGDRSIKLAQLSCRRHGLRKFSYYLRHASELELPAGLITDGEIQKPEEVIRALKGHLEKKQNNLIASPWVVSSLPETKTYIQLIKIKNQNHSEIAAADVLQAAPSYLPYNINDVYLDWQPVLNTNLSLSEEATVLLGAVPKKLADPYIYLLNIMGFTPLALEVEAVAITRAIINRQKNLANQARGILDLGATRSSFIIFDHGCVQFSLSLPFSGLAMTEKIKEALNLEFAEAENLKKDCGLDSKKCKGKLKEVIEETLNDLTEKIFQTIQFYKLHFPTRNPLTGIRLTGGGANLPALENFLSVKLKLKVRKANPWVNLFPPNQWPLSQERTLRFTTAIGLAMRALENPLA